MNILQKIGQWKSSQNPEAQGLHTCLGALGVILPAYFGIHPLIPAIIVAATGFLLEVYDRFFEPPHPIRQDIEDVAFYWLGDALAILIVLLHHAH